MLISFPFNAVACTEATTNHDSSSPLCTNEEHDITAYMTAPLASKNFVGLQISSSVWPTIFSLPFLSIHISLAN